MGFEARDYFRQRGFEILVVKRQVVDADDTGVELVAARSFPPRGAMSLPSGVMPTSMPRLTAGAPRASRSTLLRRLKALMVRPIKAFIG
jgi:hypothetical protein